MLFKKEVNSYGAPGYVLCTRFETLALSPVNLLLNRDTILGNLMRYNARPSRLVPAHGTFECKCHQTVTYLFDVDIE